MADANTMHGLTSSLTSQTMSTQGSPEQQHAHIQPQHPQHPQHLSNGDLQNHAGMQMAMAPPPPPPPQQPPVDGANPEQPVKRKPGRPKGSGKKPVDPNAPPKIKRPVGRPRKDGLPAGSVGPRRPSRPRKRPPGTFASGPQPSPGAYSYGVSLYHNIVSLSPCIALSRTEHGPERALRLLRDRITESMTAGQSPPYLISLGRTYRAVPSVGCCICASRDALSSRAPVLMLCFRLDTIRG